MLKILINLKYNIPIYIILLFDYIKLNEKKNGNIRKKLK